MSSAAEETAPVEATTTQDPAQDAPAKNDDTQKQGQPDAINGSKKRKVAMFLAYVGHGYAGMQRNPGVKTIEEDLFNAIYKAGGISDANADDRGPLKVSWMRAARTDKGVSAVRQVVSFKMILEPPGMIERINSHLPNQIRVFGVQRVTNGFDSRKHCDKRRYEYIFPAWMFSPSTTEGDVDNTKSPFVFDQDCIDRLNEILAQYKGTHNFHNYTVRTSHEAPDVKRYIMSFTCEGVMEIDGKPWVRMVVIGQSFMLHQIRKMVGMALVVFKKLAPETSLKLALESKTSLYTPMAPELGLFLDNCYYDAYNNHWGIQHGNVNPDVHSPEVDAFKAEQLYPHIAGRDAGEGINAAWMETVTEAEYKFSKWEEIVQTQPARTGLTQTDVKRRGNKSQLGPKRKRIDDARERAAGNKRDASSNGREQQQRHTVQNAEFNPDYSE